MLLQTVFRLLMKIVITFLIQKNSRHSYTQRNTTIWKILLLMRHLKIWIKTKMDKSLLKNTLVGLHMQCYKIKLRFAHSTAVDDALCWKLIVCWIWPFDLFCWSSIPAWASCLVNFWFLKQALAMQWKYWMVTATFLTIDIHACTWYSSCIYMKHTELCFVHHDFNNCKPS